MQVASVGAGDAGEGEAAGAGNEENGWTHQGSQRCLNLTFLGTFLTPLQPAQVPRGRRHGAVHPVCQVPALLPHQVRLQHCSIVSLRNLCSPTLLDFNREVSCSQLLAHHESLQQ